MALDQSDIQRIAAALGAAFEPKLREAVAENVTVRIAAAQTVFETTLDERVGEVRSAFEKELAALRAENGHLKNVLTAANEELSTLKDVRTCIVELSSAFQDMKDGAAALTRQVTEVAEQLPELATKGAVATGYEYAVKTAQNAIEEAIAALPAPPAPLALVHEGTLTPAARDMLNIAAKDYIQAPLHSAVGSLTDQLNGLRERSEATDLGVSEHVQTLRDAIGALRKEIPSVPDFTVALDAALQGMRGQLDEVLSSTEKQLSIEVVANATIAVQAAVESAQATAVKAVDEVRQKALDVEALIGAMPTAESLAEAAAEAARKVNEEHQATFLREHAARTERVLQQCAEAKDFAAAKVVSVESMLASYPTGEALAEAAYSELKPKLLDEVAAATRAMAVEEVSGWNSAFRQKLLEDFNGTTVPTAIFDLKAAVASEVAEAGITLTNDAKNALAAQLKDLVEIATADLAVAAKAEVAAALPARDTLAATATEALQPLVAEARAAAADAQSALAAVQGAADSAQTALVAAGAEAKTALAAAGDEAKTALTMAAEAAVHGQIAPLVAEVRAIEQAAASMLDSAQAAATTAQTALVAASDEAKTALTLAAEAAVQGRIEPLVTEAKTAAWEAREAKLTTEQAASSVNATILEAVAATQAEAKTALQAAQAELHDRLLRELDQTQRVKTLVKDTVQDAVIVAVDATVAELEPRLAVRLEARVQNAVDRIPLPRDGRDGKDGKDGKDGGRGKDGKIATPTLYEHNKLYEHGAWVVHRSGVWVAARDTAVEPHADSAEWDCVAPGVAAFEAMLGEDGRTVQLHCEMSNGQSTVAKFCLPIPIPRGVYNKDTAYAQHDVVTHDGSWWEALQSGVLPVPGSDKKAWRLSIKHGKDGANLKQAPPPILRYIGEWIAGTEVPANSIVDHAGVRWLALRSTRERPPFVTLKSNDTWTKLGA